jgi:acyl-ACP thioesterase
LNADQAKNEFTRPYRLRFDESGPDGLMRTSMALRLAQDAAWQHAESLGIGRGWYADRRLDWLVRAAQVRLVEPVESGAGLSVTTEVVGFRRVWARRRTTVRTTSDRLVAVVETDWVIVDADRSAPTRVPAEVVSLFSVPPGAFDPHRVQLTPPPADAVAIEIGLRRADLDPLGHANNGSYLDWAEEAVARAVGPRAVERIPRTWSLEYVAPAAPGASITVSVWPDPDRADELLVRVHRGTSDLARARLEPV